MIKTQMRKVSTWAAAVEYLSNLDFYQLFCWFMEWLDKKYVFLINEQTFKGEKKKNRPFTLVSILQSFSVAENRRYDGIDVN